MFLGRLLLTLALLIPAVASAQTNPGFTDGAPLCANVPNPNCPGQTTSLNGAFQAKADYLGTSRTQQILPLTSAGGLAQASTNYFNYTNNTFESNARIPVSIGGTFKNLYAHTGTALGGSGQTLTFTLYVNGSPTSVTCAINSGSQDCNDTIHTAIVAAGQAFSIQAVTSATTGNTGFNSASLEFDNP
jgi:hypothetical protein